MALFGRDKQEKTKDDAKNKPAAADKAPKKRLIPEDSLPELTKFFSGMQDPVELWIFTDPAQNAPYNAFMENLCRELAEVNPKIEPKFFSLASGEAKTMSVDFSPTLLLAPNRCHIRYLGAPLGEESRTLIETIFRLSVGKSGLGQTSRELLADLEAERHIQIFVNPACPYCPGQVSNAFRCAMERPDLISATCVDASQHLALAEHYKVGSVPQTVINDSLTELGLMAATLRAKRAASKNSRDRFSARWRWPSSPAGRNQGRLAAT